jgi:hypothetical protein
MKNNKIPHCQDSSKIFFEKQQNITLSGQFQHPWKTTKYNTVRTVPKFVNGDKSDTTNIWKIFIYSWFWLTLIVVIYIYICKAWAHKTNLTPPRFIEVSVRIQERERCFVCVFWYLCIGGIGFVSIYEFWNCSASVVFLFFTINWNNKIEVQYFFTSSLNLMCSI